MSEEPKKPRRYRLGEKEIQDDFLYILRRLSFCAHVRNSTGTRPGRVEGTFVRFGQKGAADIFVWMKPIGRMVAIELKSPSKSLRSATMKDQEAWHAHMRRFGVPTIITNDFNEACRFLVDSFEATVNALRTLTMSEAASMVVQAVAEMDEALRDLKKRKERKEAKKSQIPKQRTQVPQFTTI